MNKIGFYGAGNMAEAIISGLLKSGNYSPGDILAFDISPDRAHYIKEKYGILFAESEESLMKSSEYCILAVKPQILSSIENNVYGKKFSGVLVSILAGIEIARLSKIFPQAGIARIMPNSPALVGEGMTCIFYGSRISEEHKNKIEDIFKYIGKTIVIEEKHMDALTGLSGSGPAYVYQFIEAMADAGVYCGLARKDAYLLAAQTILGSARMFLETDKHPGELKDMVTSPGGTTIEGVKALEKEGFRNAVMEAVISGFEKSKQLK